ncbi:hypothetical protein PLEOSDRAFT_1105423 [Pleurotus ostreatus PC15]|uniref:Uncharacterized protein n=1 Tax=Pleurotus ostreatus (strain PC15) TaxID=1137138 RepID=A0A067NEQ3_PLEO1|nr:hypothetical protein PLEOSDRAFT_1105423 [Pleurotus ostreatus PC15]
MSFPVFLKTGDQVKVNDHVYCSPSWSVRDGTPYSIARIMEFLPPEGTPKGAGSNSQPYLYTRVRLAWYYRPSDVSDRAVSDSRLLLAAIYSEVCDINQLRAKCHVVHRDKITDLAGWKKRPDRFYFNRLFDPYIKKEFEVIQATDVRNLPENIRETLISRYEYVVAEKEVVPELTDAIRLCDTCNEWCESPETVQCDRCKKYFHMRCVQPPLLGKPSRGYGWTCAPCSKQHEEEVDSHDVRHPTPTITKPKSNAPPVRGRGRPRKDRGQAEREENLPVKHFNMWPFRYFGQYTNAKDTLDPDDLIFPRTATRQGPKYQANVPLAPDPNAIMSTDPDERGGDSTIQILSVINTLTDAEVDEMESYKDHLSSNEELKHGVDWLTEVIRRYSDAIMTSRPLSTVNMTSPLRYEKWKKNETRYTDKEWSKEEKYAFEEGIFSYGAELRAVRDEVGTRQMPEVVRYYGHWKNSKLGEENRRILRQGQPSKPPSERYKSISDANNGQRVGLPDDDASIIESSATLVCGACRTRESETWWKAPKHISANALCESCGMNWRKYADLNVRPSREESLPVTKTKASTEKREGTPLQGPSAKRSKTSASAHSTPPPIQSNVPQLRCMCCQQSGPLGKVLKCKKCQLRVHTGCYGAIVDSDSLDSWKCDLCRNEETMEASVYSDCLLCPRTRKNNKAAPSDNFLRAFKPTEGQGWAHVLCAVFTNDLTFTDASRLRLVEGMNTMNPRRFSSKCHLCGSSDGAVVRCNDCPKEYHISCAWKHGLKFGFEIQPVKNNRREVTSFKGETGSMVALILCKDHDKSRRDIYDICEADDTGETALQAYCRTYKQAPVSQAHGLLRKARRLDQIINLPDNLVNPDPGSKEPKCYECKTEFAPAFYSYVPPKQQNKVWLCHRCSLGSPHKREAIHGSMSDST